MSSNLEVMEMEISQFKMRISNDQIKWLPFHKFSNLIIIQISILSFLNFTLIFRNSTLLSIIGEETNKFYKQNKEEGEGAATATIEADYVYRG